MKTAELTGDALDFWVAKALGHKVAKSEKYGIEILDAETGHLIENTAFSTDWAHGGPEFETARICAHWSGRHWNACKIDKNGDEVCCVYGADTELIAKARALVMSIYGEEVPEV